MAAVLTNWPNITGDCKFMVKIYVPPVTMDCVIE